MKFSIIRPSQSVTKFNNNTFYNFNLVHAVYESGFDKGQFEIERVDRKTSHHLFIFFP